MDNQVQNLPQAAETHPETFEFVDGMANVGAQISVSSQDGNLDGDDLIDFIDEIVDIQKAIKGADRIIKNEAATFDREVIRELTDYEADKLLSAGVNPALVNLLSGQVEAILFTIQMIKQSGQQLVSVEYAADYIANRHKPARSKTEGTTQGLPADEADEA